jgi:hypothetical protein
MNRTKQNLEQDISETKHYEEDVKTKKVRANILDDSESKAEVEMIKKEINLLADSLRTSKVSDAETFTFNPFPTQSKAYP